jgi:hypothetical protein
MQCGGSRADTVGGECAAQGNVAGGQRIGFA